jgi:hypothetical protein
MLSRVVYYRKYELEEVVLAHFLLQFIDSTGTYYNTKYEFQFLIVIKINIAIY